MARLARADLTATVEDLSLPTHLSDFTFDEPALWARYSQLRPWYAWSPWARDRFLIRGAVDHLRRLRPALARRDAIDGARALRLVTVHADAEELARGDAVDVRFWVSDQDHPHLSAFVVHEPGRFVDAPPWTPLADRVAAALSGLATVRVFESAQARERERALWRVFVAIGGDADGFLDPPTGPGRPADG